jgi:predicted permease
VTTIDPSTHRRVVQSTTERIRTHVGTLLDHVRLDLAHVLRGLGRNVSLVAAVVTTLALGIGANATMFGIIDRLLLRAPAHITDPDRVRRLLFSARREGEAAPTALSSYPVFAAFRDGVPAFAAVAAFAKGPVKLGTGADAQVARAHFVTAGLFSLLGVRPALGRFFTPEEDAVRGGAPVAVLTNAAWRRRFGADSSILGRVLQIGTVRFEVVGVAPEGFNSIELEPFDFFLPLGAGTELEDWSTNAASNWLYIVARMRAGVSDEVAAAQARVALSRVGDGSGLPPEMFPQAVQLGSIIAGRAATQTLEVRVAAALAVISLAVLLGACANVANVLLARALHRRREVAVRIALGISRRRLAAQMALEAVLLSTIGGAAALIVAHLVGALLRTFLLGDVAWEGSPVDARVVAFTALVTTATALLIGFAPALRASRVDAATALRGGKSSTQEHLTSRRALLVSQAAFAMIIVVIAALFVRSLRSVRAIDTGMDLDHVALVTLGTGEMAPANVRSLYMEVGDRLARLPEVERLAYTAKSVPLMNATGVAIRVPGRELPPRRQGAGPYYSGVTHDFFATLGTSLVRGRTISERDETAGSRVAVVNEALVRRIWPAVNPIGSCVLLGSDSLCTEVIGVVEDIIKFQLVGEPEPEMIYIPVSHWFVRNRSLDALLVRTRGAASGVLPEMRRLVHVAAPQVADASVTSYAEMVEPQVRPWRLGAHVLTAFGLLALVICSVGLYGLMAYLVVQRTHEIGIRRALGARPRDMLRLVLGEGIVIVLTGVGLGLASALVIGRLIQGLLYGVSPTDLGAILVSAGALVATAVLASVIPMVRAIRVDPQIALRAD